MIRMSSKLVFDSKETVTVLRSLLSEIESASNSKPRVELFPYIVAGLPRRLSVATNSLLSTIIPNTSESKVTEPPNVIVLLPTESR